MHDRLYGSGSRVNIYVCSSICYQLLYLKYFLELLRDYSSTLTQEFEVLTRPFDGYSIRERLATFLVEKVINKKGEFHQPT
jgi:hypothetical protein